GTLSGQAAARIACDAEITPIIIAPHPTDATDPLSGQAASPEPQTDPGDMAGDSGDSGQPAGREWTFVDSLEGSLNRAARRLIARGSGAIIDVGTASRIIPLALRRALAARDRGCVVPGCHTPPIFCDVHHLKHWINGGATDEDNCCLLCRRHHVQHHEGRWELVKLDGGGFTTRAPP
ncbi:MAG TPA: HNH endonuclease signature motif containing protein, partial [Mycobacteriales bacterium]|nr:HNH endonuclease signature motif containing protein [Mycobacteriales bacterium]